MQFFIWEVFNIWNPTPYSFTHPHKDNGRLFTSLSLTSSLCLKTNNLILGVNFLPLLYQNSHLKKTDLRFIKITILPIQNDIFLYFIFFTRLQWKLTYFFSNVINWNRLSYSTILILQYTKRGGEICPNEHHISLPATSLEFSIDHP